MRIGDVYGSPPLKVSLALECHCSVMPSRTDNPTGLEIERLKQINGIGVFSEQGSNLNGIYRGESTLASDSP